MLRSLIFSFFLPQIDFHSAINPIIAASHELDGKHQVLEVAHCGPMVLEAAKPHQNAHMSLVVMSSAMAQSVLVFDPCLCPCPCPCPCLCPRLECHTGYYTVWVSIKSWRRRFEYDPNNSPSLCPRACMMRRTMGCPEAMHQTRHACIIPNRCNSPNPTVPPTVRFRRSWLVSFAQCDARSHSQQ